MSYSRRSRYSPSPSPPHKRYSGSVSRSRSRSKSRSYDASDIENPGNSLYVTGLSRRITKSELEKHFSAEGKVEDVRLVTDPWTRESRGFGFVSMSSIKEAESCIKHLDGSVLDGRVITVEKVNLPYSLVRLLYFAALHQSPKLTNHIKCKYQTINPEGCQEAKRSHPDSRKFVVGLRRILLIQEAVLLVIHLKEIGAGRGHTLHVTVGGGSGHTPVLRRHTADVGLTPQPQMIMVGGAATVPDLTLQKIVTTEGVVAMTPGTIRQTTEGDVSTTPGTTPLITGAEAGATGVFLEVCPLLQGGITGAGAEAAVIGVFLEVCRLLQGGITGAILLAGRPLGQGQGGGILQVSPPDLVQGVFRVTV
ncbi:hypothetical protein M8C21_000985 [Ambrosia artemisiifolia]|uniref:RRM domain-containing protein n=1 Tax=Ambrosia artemisiifolia TaxID=4212 RepID=A0AAD5BUH2_AMBAR|nr:hypothetical protein M8C21_000985 [Ambrosia artemisiifolia]